MLCIQRGTNAELIGSRLCRRTTLKKYLATELIHELIQYFFYPRLHRIISPPTRKAAEEQGPKFIKIKVPH